MVLFVYSLKGMKCTSLTYLQNGKVIRDVMSRLFPTEQQDLLVVSHSALVEENF